MRNPKFLRNLILPALLTTAIAGTGHAAVVNLTPVLGGTITGTTELAPHEKISYTFKVPVPYHFMFGFSDVIDFTTSGGPGDFVETFTNGATASTGSYTLSTAVPEPATWAMLIVGLAGVGAMTRRRNVKPAVA